jgi:hypothetical protein
MRSITKALLALNGVALLFIVLWLLVGGGSGRGYFGGGAAGEVDGVLLLLLALFNLSFLAAVLFVLPGWAAQKVQSAVQESLPEATRNEQAIRSILRTWSVWALVINGLLVLFVCLWLLINSGRWGYFQANATEVDMVLLLLLSVLNVAYMGLCWLRFSKPVKVQLAAPR